MAMAVAAETEMSAIKDTEVVGQEEDILQMVLQVVVRCIMLEAKGDMLLEVRT